MDWKAVAIVLMLIVGAELVWAYAHWTLITTAWANRDTISNLGSIAGGASSAVDLLKKL